MFARGQVVCVRFIEKGEENSVQEIWNLGVILNIEECALKRRYVISVPSATPGDITPSRKRRREPQPEHVERCGIMVLSDHPLVLFFARVSSRTFLDAFRAGKVLRWRTVHRVKEDQLYLPDPQILFRSVFS